MKKILIVLIAIVMATVCGSSYALDDSGFSHPYRKKNVAICQNVIGKLWEDEKAIVSLLTPWSSDDVKTKTILKR
jgi:hypothetical protein